MNTIEIVVLIIYATLAYVFCIWAASSIFPKKPSQRKLRKIEKKAMEKEIFEKYKILLEMQAMIQEINLEGKNIDI